MVLAFGPDAALRIFNRTLQKVNQKTDRYLRPSQLFDTPVLPAPSCWPWDAHHLLCPHIGPPQLRSFTRHSSEYWNTGQKWLEFFFWLGQNFIKIHFNHTSAWTEEIIELTLLPPHLSPPLTQPLHTPFYPDSISGLQTTTVFFTQVTYALDLFPQTQIKFVFRSHVNNFFSQIECSICINLHIF